MRTAKEIRKYLIQQRWYKDFVSNLRYRGSNVIKKITRGYLKKDTVSCGFMWDATPQGHDYWHRINDTFINWYNKGEKKYEKK